MPTVPVLGSAMSVIQDDVHLQKRGEILLGSMVVAHSFNISIWAFQNRFQGYSIESGFLCSPPGRDSDLSASETYPNLIVPLPYHKRWYGTYMHA